MGFPGGSDKKESACNAGDLGSVPGLGRSPEKKMATHSSILAWEMPQTEKPGRLQSMGWQKSWTQVAPFSLSFQSDFCLHYFTEIVVAGVIEDLCVARSSGQFPVLILPHLPSSVSQTQILVFFPPHWYLLLILFFVGSSPSS